MYLKLSIQLRGIGDNMAKDQLIEESELVGFSDGEVAFKFTEPGTRIILGHGSLHKYARSFGGYDGGDLAVIQFGKPEHAPKDIFNKQYIVGLGLGHMMRGAKVIPVDTDQLNILEIGQPWDIPALRTGDDIVKALYLDYPKRRFDGQPSYDTAIDAPSPFGLIRAMLKQANYDVPLLG